MASADFSRQILFQPCFVKKTPHVRETSPGTHTFFPSYVRRIYCKRFRAAIGLRLVWQPYPRLQPLYDFCPSDQSFASAFLRIPPRDGHPWLWLYPSHCRADSGLSPVRTCARRAQSSRRQVISSPADLSHHRAYRSVHGGSSVYAMTDL